MPSMSTRTESIHAQTVRTHEYTHARTRTAFAAVADAVVVSGIRH